MSDFGPRCIRRGPLTLIDWRGLEGSHIPSDFELLWKIGQNDEVLLDCFNSGSKEESEYSDLIEFLRQSQEVAPH